MSDYHKNVQARFSPDSRHQGVLYLSIHQDQLYRYLQTNVSLIIFSVNLHTSSNQAVSLIYSWILIQHAMDHWCPCPRSRAQRIPKWVDSIAKRWHWSNRWFCPFYTAPWSVPIICTRAWRSCASSPCLSSLICWTCWSCNRAYGRAVPYAWGIPPNAYFTSTAIFWRVVANSLCLCYTKRFDLLPVGIEINLLTSSMRLFFESDPTPC